MEPNSICCLHKLRLNQRLFVKLEWKLTDRTYDPSLGVDIRICQTLCRTYCSAIHQHCIHNLQQPTKQHQRVTDTNAFPGSTIRNFRGSKSRIDTFSMNRRGLYLNSRRRCGPGGRRTRPCTRRSAALWCSSYTHTARLQGCTSSSWPLSPPCRTHNLECITSTTIFFQRYDCIMTIFPHPASIKPIESQNRIQQPFVIEIPVPKMKFKLNDNVKCKHHS